MTERIRFLLNGCDISFIASAPKDITLDQLLKQCNRIEPERCACGIRNLRYSEKNEETDIIIDYNDIMKSNENVSCRIKNEYED